MSNDFLTHLDLCRILQQQVSCPNTPQQNGVSERKHRHIVKTGLTMMFHANLLYGIWVDSFLISAYLVNRLPSSAIGVKTPYFKLFGKHPDYCGISILGMATVVFPILDIIVQTNSLKHILVFSLAIALHTRFMDVLNPSATRYFSPGMLCLTRHCFLLLLKCFPVQR